MKATTNLNLLRVICLCLGAGLFTCESRGASLPLAASYDGTNFVTCGTYDIGYSFGDSFSQGSLFQVAGSGDIKLSRLTLPVRASTLGVLPVGTNFRLSIVEGESSFISERVVWSGMLEDTSTSFENYTIRLNGMVHGGQTYWLLYEPIGFDLGCYDWPMASSPLIFCGQEVPPDNGQTAGRIGFDGYPPEGDWYFFGRDIRGAFRILGNHVPKAEMVVSTVFKFPGSTNLLVIVPPGGRAGLRLDGTGSTDEDQEPLNFTWLDGTNVIATAALVTNQFAEGIHWISFAADDGEDATIKSARLAVVTKGGAVDELIDLVQGSKASSRDKQTLTKVLVGAMQAFDKGKGQVAVTQLRSFQRLVKTQARLVGDSTAVSLIGAAEEIVKRAN